MDFNTRINTRERYQQGSTRERDINHKDKQNYDAVLHMTNKSVITLLTKIPVAKGTHAYLDVVRSVIDSFLDGKLDSLTRIKKAWYAVFFVRYWRQWLLLKPDYTIGNNCITLNAYMCIELNAHSLITFLLTVYVMHFRLIAVVLFLGCWDHSLVRRYSEQLAA